MGLFRLLEAARLSKTSAYPGCYAFSKATKTPFHSTWLAKARLLHGWRPTYDLKKLTDAAFDFQRPADDLVPGLIRR